MSIWQRIAREPNAILGLVVAVYGVLVAFHVLELDRQQIGALTILGGAAVVALRWLVTPAREVVARRKPGKVRPEAGPASAIPDGTPVRVLKRGDRGATDVQSILISSCLLAAGFVLALVMGLVGRT